MAKLGKRARAAKEAFAGKDNVTVEEAVALIKGNAKTKFDQTVEIGLSGTELVEIDRLRGEAFMLHPGEFVLGSTLERVKLADDLVARVEGKSSLGRLGLLVHATAGYVDPGWDGHDILRGGGAGREDQSRERCARHAATLTRRGDVRGR